MGNPSFLDECHLSDEYKAIAQRDLREDDTIRKQSLEQMVEWIEKHPFIKSCRTDARFLVAFLRKKKFSIVEARQLLEGFLRFYSANPQYFANLTLKDPAIAAMVDCGYNIPLPKKDKNGRLIVWHRTGKVNPATYDMATSMRAMSLMFQALLYDEEAQVGAVTVVLDHEGLTWDHAKLLTIFDLRIIFTSVKVTPVRIKDVYMVNMPGFIQKIVDLADPILASMMNLEKRKVSKVSSLDSLLKSFVSQLVLRFFFQTFKDWDELKKVIDPALLPKEIGGTIPTEEILRDFKAKIAKMEEECKDLPPFEFDLANADPDWDKQDVDLGVSGSFRKLGID